MPSESIGSDAIHRYVRETTEHSLKLLSQGQARLPTELRVQMFRRVKCVCMMPDGNQLTLHEGAFVGAGRLSGATLQATSCFVEVSLLHCNRGDVIRSIALIHSIPAPRGKICWTWLQHSAQRHLAANGAV